MARTKGHLAGIGLVVFCAVAIIAFCVTILCVTREQLYNAEGWCQYYGIFAVQCVIAADQCWISTSPLDDNTPCNYLYAVGAIGLLFQIVIAMLPCWAFLGAAACMGITAFLNFGWFISAAIYFQIQIQDISSDVPAEKWRKVIQGMVWTSFALSVVQLVAVAMVAKATRRADDEFDSPKKPQKDVDVAAKPYGA